MDKVNLIKGQYTCIKKLVNSLYLSKFFGQYRSYDKINIIMFDFINEKLNFCDRKEIPKKYISCRFLNYGISFMHSAIKTCCHSKEGITFYSDYKGEKINWKNIEKKRKEIIRKCMEGDIPENCKGCINLVNQKWDNSFLIKEIVINNWDQCNCNCIYCVYSSHGTYLQTKKQPSKYYNVYKHLKWLYSHKKIDKYAKIVFVGGDLTILDESDKIIDLCLKNKIYFMFFHTSAIFYSKGIEKAIKKAPIVKFDFSLDCGCRETYKKIKRIDTFDNVIENIKRYMACSPKAQNVIIAKYIIIKDYNDNVEELEKWINLIVSLKIKYTKLEFDLREFDIKISNKREFVKPNYYELYKSYYNLIQKHKLIDESTSYTKQVLKEGGLPKNYC